MPGPASGCSPAPGQRATGLREAWLRSHLFDARAVDAQGLERRFDDTRGIQAGFGILLLGLVMLLEPVRQAHGADLEAAVGQAFVARQRQDVGAEAANRG